MKHNLDDFYLTFYISVKEKIVDTLTLCHNPLIYHKLIRYCSKKLYMKDDFRLILPY